MVAVSEGIGHQRPGHSQDRSLVPWRDPDAVSVGVSCQEGAAEPRVLDEKQREELDTSAKSRRALSKVAVTRTGRADALLPLTEVVHVDSRPWLRTRADHGVERGRPSTTRPREPDPGHRRYRARREVGTRPRHRSQRHHRSRAAGSGATHPRPATHRPGRSREIRHRTRRHDPTPAPGGRANAPTVREQRHGARPGRSQGPPSRPRGRALPPPRAAGRVTTALPAR